MDYLGQMKVKFFHEAIKETKSELPAKEHVVSPPPTAHAGQGPPKEVRRLFWTFSSFKPVCADREGRTPDKRLLPRFNQLPRFGLFESEGTVPERRLENICNRNKLEQVVNGGIVPEI